jgi:hypothetical protein
MFEHLSESAVPMRHVATRSVTIAFLSYLAFK